MRFFIFGFLLISLLSTGAFLFVLFNLPPVDSDGLILSSVYYFLLSGFVCLASSVSLVLYSFSLVFGSRKKDSITHKERGRNLFIQALRRGIGVGSIFLLLSILKLLGIFNPLNAILIVLVIGLFEIYLTK